MILNVKENSVAWKRAFWEHSEWDDAISQNFKDWRSSPGYSLVFDNPSRFSTRLVNVLFSGTWQRGMQLRNHGVWVLSGRCDCCRWSRLCRMWLHDVWTRMLPRQLHSRQRNSPPRLHLSHLWIRMLPRRQSNRKGAWTRECKRMC